MLRSKVAPPGARVPLVVLVVALAVGALVYLGVHRHADGAPGAPRSLASAPAQASPGGRATATR